MKIGWFTFADVPAGDASAARRRIPELIEEIALADEVGLDIFGLGEHHHPGFAAPAPAVILAAAAARTKNIRLTSAVSVLGSDDPVRVFEQFTALDLVSGGRAEIMAGRGALLDSFRIFGHDLADYDALFEEKLKLLLDLRGTGPVTWSGRFRPPLEGELIVPRPVQNPLPVWLAVGGTPSSVVRAARLGLPLALGTIGGDATHFAPFVELYREGIERFGQPALPIAVTLHGFVADTSQKAGDIYFPADAVLFNTAGAARGVRGVTAAHIAAKNGPGSMYAVGSPQQVIEKLLHQHEILGHQSTMLQLAVGPIEHRDIMRAIELLGTEVAPAVRAEVARRQRSRTPETSPFALLPSADGAGMCNVDGECH
ncbi:LLM class flavin-dependent oxidoreductase [Saccharomonospora sp. NPDC046836]|uniref:LLM class flavin-dependent oxidoreductase n=1 Tax=Saccharomonospora sp. NPDC046836 TaxID=3156921 RepID=UPI0033FA8D12